MNRSDSKKIIFVTHLFSPACGGVETHLTRLAGALASRGFQVKVLTTDAYSTEAFFLNDKRRIEKKAEVMDGVEIERLGFRTWGRRILNLLRSLACRLKYPCNNWIRFYSFGPRNSLFFKKILQYRPDIIFAAPLPTFNIYYAWKAAKKLKVPLIINPAYHIHDPCSYDNPIFFRIMRDAHLIAVHSEREKEHIAQKIGGDTSKVLVFPPLPIEENDLIPHSGSRPSREKIKQRYGIKESHVLLCLGQHGRHKNISGLIKAMDLVWQAVPDTALVIAGGTTAYTPQLKAAALEYDQDSRQKIYFLDNFPESQKKQIYLMADIYVSLSDFESFGIVFVEAMLHNLPVIASGNSVSSSIVDEFHTGILVDPHCDAEIAGAVLELLLDEEIRKIYGANGKRQALQDYSPKEILDRWEKTLNSSW